MIGLKLENTSMEFVLPKIKQDREKYRLPFAEMGLDYDPREVKSHSKFIQKREEVLAMIGEMEAEIMGRAEGEKQEHGYF